MPTPLSIIYWVLYFSFTVYFTVGFALSVGMKAELFCAIFDVVKWPALVFVPLKFVYTIWAKPDLPPWLRALDAVICGLVWWVYRNEGNDDWKKRLHNKLTEKVERVRGRLIIVPASAH